MSGQELPGLCSELVVAISRTNFTTSWNCELLVNSVVYILTVSLYWSKAEYESRMHSFADRAA